MDPCILCECCLSLISYELCLFWFRGTCFLGALHSLWLLHSFWLHFFGPLVPEGRDLMETYYWGHSVMFLDSCVCHFFCLNAQTINWFFFFWFLFLQNSLSINLEPSLQKNNSSGWQAVLIYTNIYAIFDWMILISGTHIFIKRELTARYCSLNSLYVPWPA